MKFSPAKTRKCQPMATHSHAEARAVPTTLALQGRGWTARATMPRANGKARAGAGQRALFCWAKAANSASASNGSIGLKAQHMPRHPLSQVRIGQSARERTHVLLHVIYLRGRG